MSYVVINALTVPGGNGEVLEQRFAGRAGLVEQAEGFEEFQLLRPVEGTDRYLVYTRWRTAADFEAWQSSRDFGKGHAQAARDRRLRTAGVQQRRRCGSSRSSSRRDRRLVPGTGRSATISAATRRDDLTRGAVIRSTRSAVISGDPRRRDSGDPRRRELGCGRGTLVLAGAAPEARRRPGRVAADPAA